MSAPHDPQGPPGADELELGADYEAFLADAQRALEPTAADATRVRAGLDAALSARGALPTEPTSQGVGGAGQAGEAASGRSAASITVRWVGLAVLALAVLGGATLSLREGSAADASGAAPTTGVDGAALGEPSSGGYEGTPGRVDGAGSSVGATERGDAESSAAASDEPGVRGARGEDAPDADGAAPESPPADRGAPSPDPSGMARVRSRSAPTPSGPGAGHDSTESGNPPAASSEGTSGAANAGSAGTASSAGGAGGAANTASGAAMPSEPSLLAREAARLLRARNALSAGRPSEALELTTRLPEGDPLGPERRAIRVRALCALGRTAEARQVAGTLGQGNGPSAAAVRASCVGEP